MGERVAWCVNSVLSQQESTSQTSSGGGGVHSESEGSQGLEISAEMTGNYHTPQAGGPRAEACSDRDLSPEQRSLRL